MPVASDWTGDPLGVAWNLPTAAVQNASSDFVTPTETAAQAAEDDATLAATTDPTTNNLVTFNATGHDAATAYNNYLMMESYLLVPTNGLSADKALGARPVHPVRGRRHRAGGHQGAGGRARHHGHADSRPHGGTDARRRSGVGAGVDRPRPRPARPGSGSGSTSTTTTVASSAAATGNTGAGISPSTDPSTHGGLADTGATPCRSLDWAWPSWSVGEVARRFFRRRRSRA